mmetsp:Transcript_78790/g.170308  ORF Transcript_78790/g.170308 Transcript_78790/m.170308 type:complete len:270 (+) Transcript_78790:1475-2284(+)
MASCRPRQGVPGCCQELHELLHRRRMGHGLHENGPQHLRALPRLQRHLRSGPGDRRRVRGGPQLQPVEDAVLQAAGPRPRGDLAPGRQLPDGLGAVGDGAQGVVDEAGDWIHGIPGVQGHDGHGPTAAGCLHHDWRCRASAGLVARDGLHGRLPGPWTSPRSPAEALARGPPGCARRPAGRPVGDCWPAEWGHADAGTPAACVPRLRHQRRREGHRPRARRVGPPDQLLLSRPCAGRSRLRWPPRAPLPRILRVAAPAAGLLFKGQAGR